jgi:hypothetical protein
MGVAGLSRKGPDRIAFFFFHLIVSSRWFSGLSSGWACKCLIMRQTTESKNTKIGLLGSEHGLFGYLTYYYIFAHHSFPKTTDL